VSAQCRVECGYSTVGLGSQDDRRVPPPRGRALRAVAAAFVRFCRGQGLIRGEWLAIDGSKLSGGEPQSVLSRERCCGASGARSARGGVPKRLDAADAEEGETTIDAGAVREALEVLRRQQAQTAQGLGGCTGHSATSLG